MNRQKKEDLKQAKQQQGDHPQHQGQTPALGQQSQQPRQAHQPGDQSGQQEAFRPTDTD
jgi:hypothetical protein